MRHCRNQCRVCSRTCSKQTCVNHPPRHHLRRLLKQLREKWNFFPFSLLTSNKNRASPIFTESTNNFPLTNHPSIFFSDYQTCVTEIKLFKKKSNSFACIEMSCPIQLSRPLNICQLHQSITDALGNLPFSSGSSPV